MIEHEGKKSYIALGMNTFAFTVCFAAWMLNGVLVTYLVSRGIFEWTPVQIGILIGVPVLDDHPVGEVVRRRIEQEDAQRARTPWQGDPAGGVRCGAQIQRAESVEILALVPVDEEGAPGRWLHAVEDGHGAPRSGQAAGDDSERLSARVVIKRLYFHQVTTNPFQKGSSSGSTVIALWP